MLLEKLEKKEKELKSMKKEENFRKNLSVREVKGQ